MPGIFLDLSSFFSSFHNVWTILPWFLLPIGIIKILQVMHFYHDLYTNIWQDLELSSHLCKWIFQRLDGWKGAGKVDVHIGKRMDQLHKMIIIYLNSLVNSAKTVWTTEKEPIPNDINFTMEMLSCWHFSVSVCVCVCASALQTFNKVFNTPLPLLYLFALMSPENAY